MGKGTKKAVKKAATRDQKCGKCKGAGHNARTCGKKSAAA